MAEVGAWLEVLTALVAGGVKLFGGSHCCLRLGHDTTSLRVSWTKEAGYGVAELGGAILCWCRGSRYGGWSAKAKAREATG